MSEAGHFVFVLAFWRSDYSLSRLSAKSAEVDDEQPKVRCGIVAN